MSSRTAITIATMIGALFALTGLGRQPLSWDETVSATAALRSVPALMRLLQHTDAPLGAYYLMLHGWVTVLAAVHVTPTAAWLRVPSAAAAVGTVALVALLGARWWGAQAGLFAGVVLAVHPLAVFYAHDARPYSIAVLAMLGATAILRRTLERPDVLRLATYGLLVTVAIYAHMFTALALIGHVAVIVTRPGPRRRFVLVGIAILGAVAPLLLVARHEGGEIGWIPRLSWAAAASFGARLAGDSMGLPLIMLATATAYALWQERRRTGREIGERAWLLILCAVVPATGLLTVDLIQPVLVVRYALVSVPALALLAARGATRAGTRLGPALIALALLAGAVTSAVQQAQPYKYDDFRAASDIIADTAHRSDALVFIPSSMRVGYDRYRFIDRNNPHPVDVAAIRSVGPLVAPSIGGTEIAAVDIGGAMTGHDRIYVIDGGDVHPNPTDTAKLAILRAAYRRVWTHGYGDITVTLFVHR